MTYTHPEKRLIGYARVSTYGQTLDAQLEQLRAAGCSSRNIYHEKVTGAHSDHRQLLKMLDALAPGDVVAVTRIDRLARSTFDLFGIVKRIVDAKAQFRSLAKPWPTRHQHRAFDAGGIGRACRCRARDIAADRITYRHRAAKYSGAGSNVTCTRVETYHRAPIVIVPPARAPLQAPFVARVVSGKH